MNQRQVMDSARVSDAPYNSVYVLQFEVRPETQEEHTNTNDCYTARACVCLIQKKVFENTGV